MALGCSASHRHRARGRSWSDHAPANGQEIGLDAGHAISIESTDVSRDAEWVEVDIPFRRTSPRRCDDPGIIAR